MTSSEHAAPRRLVIAIDGPAGAGKSSVTAQLAERLGYTRVDTGAMYRAVALAAMEADIALDEAGALGAFAHKLVDDRALEFSVREGRAVSVRPSALSRADAAAPSPPAQGSGGTVVELYGRDISAEIRTPSVSMGASAVARVPRVREALLLLQRQQAARGGVILEGRDIGTVVLPNADLKIFLTASPEVRANRRYNELRAKGTPVTFEETLADVMQRDAADEGREVAPLRRADDAVLFDSSDLSEDEVLERLVELSLRRQAELRSAPSEALE